MLSETSPDILEEYLTECLEFLMALTSSPSCLYLPLDIKAKLEVTLVSVMSVSQLKSVMSCLRSSTMAKLVNIAANLLAARSAKEQTESPLLFSLVKFQ